MLAGSNSIARALNATADAADLLKLTHRAVHRAQLELDGDAKDVAERLSQQLQYLREVADVLRHEIERIARQEGPMETWAHAVAPRTKAVVHDRPIR